MFFSVTILTLLLQPGVAELRGLSEVLIAEGSVSAACDLMQAAVERHIAAAAAAAAAGGGGDGDAAATITFISHTLAR